jgi:hypothetical protein
MTPIPPARRTTLATAVSTCECGRTIEREPGSPWKHLDGWTLCDPHGPGTARVHPASLPDSWKAA